MKFGSASTEYNVADPIAVEVRYSGRGEYTDAFEPDTPGILGRRGYKNRFNAQYEKPRKR
jgi:hypothetical protein